jgi:glycosyltransferase involved in cell wall biosynthesis
LRCKKKEKVPKKFKILHTEWSEGFGGQEMRILLEIHQHLKQGHEVFLLAPPESPLLKAAKNQGMDVIPLKIRHTFDLQALWRIKKIILEKEIEILHTHSSVDSWVASLAGKWAGVPLLVRTRHISVPARTHRFNKVYSLPDAVITTGEHIRRNLMEGYHLSADRVFSIPTGVDTDRFYPRPPEPLLKKRLGLPEGSLVVSLAAVLRAQKRHELVIAAAPAVLQKYPQTRFLFVGEGPRRNLIAEELKRTQMAPFFLMTGYREDLPELLSITDVGVVSSQAEGIPQALLQTMAMAKPMVATRVGGIPDIIRDGVNGLLIPPEDPQALAGALLTLLDDRAYAVRLGKKAQELIREKYSADQMAEEVSQVYRKMFEKKKRREG